MTGSHVLLTIAESLICIQAHGSSLPCSGRLFEDDFNNVTVSEGKSKGNWTRQGQALG